MKYEKYKDSGVAWMGEIPDHWNAIRIKWLLNERIEKSDDGIGEPLSMSQKFGLIPTKDMDAIPNAASTYVGAKKTYIGDLVLNKLKAHLGVFSVSKYNGLISPDYAVYMPSGISNICFLEYLFKTKIYISEFIKKTTGVAIGFNRLYTDDLFSIYAHVPPLPEQQAIVTYLDTKTALIDKAIEGKLRQQTLLREAKQSLIAEAVTKGINHNVALKDSGISWLGEIPEHWEVKKLRIICRESKVKNKGMIESKVLSLSYGRIIRKADLNKGLTPADYSTYQIVEKDNIVLRLTDLQNDHTSLRTGLVKERGIITSAYVCIVVKGANAHYTHLSLHTFDILKMLYSMGDGLRQSMSYDDLSNIDIPVPPLAEQQAIVDYIESKTQKIDTMIATLDKQVEQLKAYRQRLIADVVTGQKKVC